ncbi:nitroreductase family protein [Candidatus Formimonas warabiya]|uniref:Nitroreductase domain-containing protein n=1 Tax=Formimonas warabiya TaxID=1761012 RepID=A0A3G1KZ33_FORW1|nr:nitroreductase family protein [Candidatus Formimonas warabiya]ATW27742.1 hypothetical protein DCMF_25970 [Candidatus Formimonas warabiya]
MELDVFEALVKKRRSIRKWLDKKVPEQDILKAIELGGYAPNGGNSQSYHFYIVSNETKIKEIALAVEQKMRLIASWPEAAPLQGQLEQLIKSGKILEKAPALVLVCFKTGESSFDHLLDSRPLDENAVKTKEALRKSNSKLQSAAAAINTMLLAFHIMGLGALWMSGPVRAKEEIEKIVGIPENLDFIALIPVGYPAEEPAMPPRKKVEEITTILK